MENWFPTVSGLRIGKPRIRFVMADLWVCQGNEFVGVGTTPSQAFNIWRYALTVSRYGGIGIPIPRTCGCKTDWTDHKHPIVTICGECVSKLVIPI